MQLESSVTLFDDTKVEDRFAELQITADGITSEVSRKVGNDEVISRINQSAEGVQIQANKVNIEGAAIFSSGRLSQNSLNNAYDAKGAATGEVNNLKSDLSLSSGTTVINGGHIATGSLAIGTLDTDAQNAIDDAGKKASTYITDIGSGGISVHAASNPTSNYVQIDGTGMEVYKGGAKVAKFGASIMLSDGTRTVYEVVNKTNDTVTVKRVYNVTLDATRMIGFDDYIALGRTVSSWISNGIKLTYKRNGGASQTVTFSSMPVASSAYGVWCTLNGTTVETMFRASDTTSGSDTYTIVSIEFNFKTTQQVVESTLGAYADSTMSGAFKVGKGTGDNAKANAMLLDWGGSAMFGGDVVAYCNNDSSGGLSLTRERYENAYYYSSGSSTWFEIASYIIGRMVTLVITATKGSSTSSGSNLFDIDLSSVHIPKPVHGIASGMTYYGAHSIGLLIDSNSHLTVRNASNSAVTASGSLQGTLTYLCQTDPETNAIKYFND